MSIFLRVKHWQLFLVVFGLPLVISFVLVGLMIYYVSGSEGNISAEIVFDKFFYILIAAFISNSTLLLWQWSVTIGLQNKVPDSLKLKTIWFKTFFFVSVTFLIYVMLTIILFLEVFNGMHGQGFVFGLATSDFTNSVFLILPIQLLSLLSFFGCIYFAAKTIRTVELQQEVKVGDFVAEFFMVWFFPIGIWFLQPRINRIVRDEF